MRGNDEHFVAFSGPECGSFRSMKSLSIPELHAASQSPKSDEIILDVRTPGEFAEGHVPGSKNIPFDQVMNHFESLQKYKKIYVYCRAGGRATTACQILETMGAKNLLCVDDGGFPDWVESGFKVSTHG
jgi:phage shock protein E